MSTVDQTRAKFALAKVKGVLENPAMKDKREKFLIELRHLPASLHWGGLGQTAASLLADTSNKPRQEIHHWLEDWLRESNIYTGPKGKQPTLMEAITGSDVYGDLEDRYVAATREARALAVWLKKFAEAFLRDTAGNDKKSDKGKEKGDAAAAS